MIFLLQMSIDEIDAVGTKRYDAHSGRECEIQRIMLELLNQLDVFDSRDVKVILATNCIESLDPALLHPGRIDRKIKSPLPDVKTRRHIFQHIHTSKMALANDVNIKEFLITKDEFSGADIKAICTEAGLLALRERLMKVTHADFKKAKEKVMYKKKEGLPEGLYM